MKKTLLCLMLIGMIGQAAFAENPRANRKAANARKATIGKPLPPPRPDRIR